MVHWFLFFTKQSSVLYLSPLTEIISSQQPCRQPLLAYVATKVLSACGECWKGIFFIGTIEVLVLQLGLFYVAWFIWFCWELAMKLSSLTRKWFFPCLVFLLHDEEDLKSFVLRFILNVDMVRLESVADNVILGVTCSWVTKFWLNVDNSTAIKSNVAMADGSSWMCSPLITYC